jgi:hypothetical protein
VPAVEAEVGLPVLIGSSERRSLPLGELWEAGLLDAESVVEDHVVVRQGGGRRAGNLRVVKEPGPSFFVKRAERPSDLPWVRHDARMLRRLSADGSPVRHLVPRLISRGDDDGTLVTELLTDATSLSQYQATTAVAPPAVGAAIGRALARIHELPASLGDDGPGDGLPTALANGRLALGDYVALSAASVEAIRRVQRSGACDLIAELAEGWRRDRLVHGDVRPANILVSGIGGESPSVRLIDWEFAAPGDACWDLGSLFGHALHTWLDSVPRETEEPDLDAASRPLDDVKRLVGAAWAAYRGAGGAREEDYALLRAVRYAGACLIETALAIGSEARELTRSQLLHLQLGDHLLKEPLVEGVRYLGFAPGDLG